METKTDLQIAVDAVLIMVEKALLTKDYDDLRLKIVVDMIIDKINKPYNESFNPYKETGEDVDIRFHQEFEQLYTEAYKQIENKNVIKDKND